MSAHAGIAAYGIKERNRDVERFPKISKREELIGETKVATVRAVRLERMMREDDRIPVAWPCRVHQDAFQRAANFPRRRVRALEPGRSLAISEKPLGVKHNEQNRAPDSDRSRPGTSCLGCINDIQRLRGGSFHVFALPLNAGQPPLATSGPVVVAGHEYPTGPDAAHDGKLPVNGNFVPASALVLRLAQSRWVDVVAEKGDDDARRLSPQSRVFSEEV